MNDRIPPKLLRKKTPQELVTKISELRAINKAMAAELIEVKQEKTHNEQLLDSFQNALADNGYKLVDINES